MAAIKIYIDGREIVGEAGQTILAFAQSGGIEIPTLCHDARVESYGSCGICVVEAEGSPRLLRACSTVAADGMRIHTNTERVRKTRQSALELLLSDHTGDCRSPCSLACPAQTDCQGYVGLIANGAYSEAAALVRETNPLPASIGRVCPHPCETACRRTLTEEPIAIADLKRFAGDMALAGNESETITAAPTGKTVAVIGGGPGGLSAAYYLRKQGHAVTLYDAMPAMGGMLRYGIPAYRLPRELLQKEIDHIHALGAEFRNNTKVGRDITLDELRSTYDAVVIAIGAWSSMGLRCPGEDLDGVTGGIEFLRTVDPDIRSLAGKRVAVVGGGNTAMDACRTALRLGAAAVYSIYRRTRNEMPAEEIEINEAEEEGVCFKTLRNPLEIRGEDGKVTELRLQVMALGAPDASGRRSPEPVPGEEESLAVDVVIAAIGQRLNAAGFEAIEKTKRGTIAADENTFCTNLDGVFAIGDAVNKGADIAIAAIGDAKKAAGMVGRYLNGEALVYAPDYLVASEKTEEDFADQAREPRAKMPQRPAAARRHDFREVNLGLSEAEAKREAFRCLECGCADYFECKLYRYANEYEAQSEKYTGAKHKHRSDEEHPFIRRNPEKCILCGLCVRVCDEVAGATAFGLVDRGFDTVVKPALDMDLRCTDCVACGLCVEVCPTGALTETTMAAKQVPLQEESSETTCPHCEIGCKVRLTKHGALPLRALPAAEDGLLCQRGRFGFDGKRELLDVSVETEAKLLEKIAAQNGYTGEMPPPGLHK